MQQNELKKIEFASEHSDWLLMKDGSKRWDARVYDMADYRCYAMSIGNRDASGKWRSDVKEVVFTSNETHDELVMQLDDILFVPWAPGWVFMMIHDPNPDLPW